MKIIVFVLLAFCFFTCGSVGAAPSPTSGGRVAVTTSLEDRIRAREREDKSDQHDVDDLRAQRDAAKAAQDSARINQTQLLYSLIQLVVTSIGTVAAIAGTIYVVLSVRKATEANETSAEALKHSVETADAELRPWLQFSLSVKTGLSFDKEANNAAVVARVRNLGKMPALNVRLEMHAWPARKSVGRKMNDSILQKFTVGDNVSSSSGIESNVVLPEETETFSTGFVVHGKNVQELMADETWSMIELRGVARIYYRYKKILYFTQKEFYFYRLKDPASEDVHENRYKFFDRNKSVEKGTVKIFNIRTSTGEQKIV